MQVLTYFIYATAVLLCIYLLLINLYYFWFSTLKVFQPAADIQPVTRFSIIIPARNEEKNITACVNSIIQNNYPKQLYEIIIADDFSTDSTPAIVQHLQEYFSNINLISLNNLIEENINSYKKRAIEIAISQSKFEWIITTDADCIAPQDWLHLFDAYIQTNQTVFIAAPVMFSNLGNFLSIFQCLDFMRRYRNAQLFSCII